MNESIALANIEFGTGDDGKPTAIITFKITDENPLPSALDFEVDVIVRHDGNVAGAESVAKRAFHALTASLAEKTKGWASGQP